MATTVTITACPHDRVRIDSHVLTPDVAYSGLSASQIERLRETPGVELHATAATPRRRAARKTAATKTTTKKGA
jgi:hypothetical protein